MLISILVAASFGIAFIAYAVVLLRLFHPHQYVVALLLYALSWIVFLFSVLLSGNVVVRNRVQVWQFLRRNVVHIVLGLLIFVLGYIIWVLVPFESSPLNELSPPELEQQLQDDATTLLFLREQLAAHQVDQEVVALFATPAHELNAAEKAVLKTWWQQMIRLLFELDLLKNRYRTFVHLDAPDVPMARPHAFGLAYGAFLAEYEAALRLSTQFEAAPTLKRLLSEPDPDLSVPPDSVATVIGHAIAPSDRLRFAAGKAYLAVLESWDNEPAILAALQADIADIDGLLGDNTVSLVEQPLDFFERLAFQAWFPVQRELALQLSYIRASRQPFALSAERLTQAQRELEPGDILLERRNWKATNMGVPGFWIHSALYVGTVSEIDRVFADVPELKGELPSAFLAREYPDAHAHLIQFDPDGHPYSVIESKRPGVVMLSFQESAHADALAVLRPRLPVEQKWQALLQSFTYLGRPYDYNFDLATDSALLCSEFIFKSYTATTDLRLQSRIVNGRPMYLPNFFAERFARDFGTDDQQLDFVAFLEYNLDTATVETLGIDEFRESWKRPKWYFAH